MEPRSDYFFFCILREKGGECVVAEAEEWSCWLALEGASWIFLSFHFSVFFFVSFQMHKQLQERMTDWMRVRQCTVYVCLHERSLCTLFSVHVWGLFGNLREQEDNNSPFKSLPPSFFLFLLARLLVFVATANGFPLLFETRSLRAPIRVQIRCTACHIFVLTQQTTVSFIGSSCDQVVADWSNWDSCECL